MSAKSNAPLAEDEAKKLYERMVELEAGAHATNEQLQALHEQLQHLKQTITTVEELQALTEPKETWVPIAPGAYIKATVHPASTVMLAVGAGTAVEKKPEDVLETLKGHVATLEELADGAIQELKDSHAEMERIKERVEGTPVPGNPAHGEPGHVHGPGCEHIHTHRHDHGHH